MFNVTFDDGTVVHGFDKKEDYDAHVQRVKELERIRTNPTDEEIKSKQEMIDEMGKFIKK